MSENKPKELNSQVIPFFTRFLEKQNSEELSEQELKAINGGASTRTLKYPSDSDELHTNNPSY
ncbi:microviridin/marinostatin family tricyclic proteinase inhibitor [Brasilonema sp. CT11]|nr:microviridin/marinostatin family tricyclic proteinase inhibitor [Brasilonema sp. CT11]